MREEPLVWTEGHVPIPQTVSLISSEQPYPCCKQGIAMQYLERLETEQCLTIVEFTFKSAQLCTCTHYLSKARLQDMQMTGTDAMSARRRKSASIVTAVQYG
jgi:hypothetical protein